jgi:hypothetical protein
MGALNPLQIWMFPLGICKTSKANTLTSPLKKKPFHNLPDPRAASVGAPWLETVHFQKHMYMQDVLCSAVERIVQLKC